MAPEPFRPARVSRNGLAPDEFSPLREKWQKVLRVAKVLLWVDTVALNLTLSVEPAISIPGLKLGSF
jgi:hypothetical protein